MWASNQKSEVWKNYICTKSLRASQFSDFSEDISGDINECDFLNIAYWNVSSCFSNDHCMAQNHAWVKDSFKM